VGCSEAQRDEKLRGSPIGCIPHRLVAGRRDCQQLSSTDLTLNQYAILASSRLFVRPRVSRSGSIRRLYQWGLITGLPGAGRRRLGRNRPTHAEASEALLLTDWIHRS